MVANTMLYFLLPGVIDKIRAGEVLGFNMLQVGTEILLLIAITYFWVPLVMAVLSLTLKDKANRWANVILGIFYVGFILFEFAITITTTMYPYGARWPYIILMDTSMVVAATLIVWYAWKSKQKA
jgi:cytochrome bd-type quinol oxidase subunit 2